MSGEFYKNDYGGRRGEKPHRSLLMWLLDLVMTLLTVVVGATMAVTYFVPYVNPAGVWFFPLLGLAAPAIYVATVILALYWVIRWRLLRAGTMLALVVIGLFKVSLFYKPEFRRSYGEESYDRRAFKVMTYNVRSFFGESGASNVDDIVRLIGEYDPHAGSRFAVWGIAFHPEQIPYPALGHRPDPQYVGLGRPADR